MAQIEKVRLYSTEDGRVLHPETDTKKIFITDTDDADRKTLATKLDEIDTAVATQKEDFEHYLDDYNTFVGSTNNSLARDVQDITNLQEEVKELKPVVKTSSEDIDDLKTRMSSAEEHISELTTNLSATTDTANAADELSKSTKSEFDVLNTKIGQEATAEAPSTGLIRDLRFAQDDIEALEDDVEDLESEVETLETNVTTLNTNVSNLSESVSEYNEKVENIKSEVSSLTDDVTTFDAKIDAINDNLTKKIDNNEERIITINDNLVGYHAEIIKNSETIEQLKASYEAKVSLIDEKDAVQDERLDSAEERLDDIEDEINRETTGILARLTSFKTDYELADLGLSSRIDSEVGTRTSETAAINASISMINDQIRGNEAQQIKGIIPRLVDLERSTADDHTTIEDHEDRLITVEDKFDLYTPLTTYNAGMSNIISIARESAVTAIADACEEGGTITDNIEAIIHNGVESDIIKINSVIPTTASSDNKLATVADIKSAGILDAYLTEDKQKIKKDCVETSDEIAEDSVLPISSKAVYDALQNITDTSKPDSIGKKVEDVTAELEETQTTVEKLSATSYLTTDGGSIEGVITVADLLTRPAQVIKSGNKRVVVFLESITSDNTAHFYSINGTTHAVATLSGTNDESTVLSLTCDGATITF